MSRLKKILAVVLLAAALSVWGFFAWKRGTPYQSPYWSPNGAFYVQKYSNPSPFSSVTATPGQGSDSIGGYIRLYDRAGKMLHERYVPFSRDVEPLWSGNRVFLRGVAAMDNDPWILPRPVE